MDYDPSHVLFLLHKKFGSPIPTDPVISRREMKMANHVGSLIEQGMYGDVEVEEIDELADEQDGDYEQEEFQAFDNVVPSLNEVMFGEKAINREQVQEALEYYRQPAKGCRSLPAMTSRFRWITSERHLCILRKYEKEGQDYKESRTNLLKLLAKRLYEVVKEKLEKGISLHDADLMMIAKHLNRSETKVQKFIACQSWITRWKKSHKIVSRRITRFVTRKCLLNKVEIQKIAERFVAVTRQELASFDPSMVFNADQTGVQKELYGARALAFLGEKIVERLVQAKSSLTHSFTFLPMLFLNGTLGPKAYMVLAEPTGQFPPSRPIPNCPNLVVRAGKTHMMSKTSVTDWCKSCVFIDPNPKKLLMLIDSWTGFIDHSSIRCCIPSGYDVTIRNLPPHTTSMIQPLDAHWNGPWKNLLKKFTSFALNFHPDYLIAQRNNEIWMISLMYHQMSALKFEPFMKYAWKKAGYIDTASPFLTPAQYCFADQGQQDCYAPGCTDFSFIHCARCEKYLCFDHFIVEEKHLCSSA